jgi:hypothetical protein
VITDLMVDAAARAVFARTKTGQLVDWDQLPPVVQHELREVALEALKAAEPLRWKPES